MYPRIYTFSQNKSFFVFGPRGTGKSSWLRENIKNANYIDLLSDDIYRKLLAYPEELINFIKPNSEWVIIDEVQRVPDLLNEVHRLIEISDFKFILSGSSARKLKRAGVNLLAGRAITTFMHPFVSNELGDDFDFNRALLYGMLPEVWDGSNPSSYLKSYVTTYLKEEIQQEGLTRNLGNFSRFLEVASFSQSTLLNVTNIAREVGIDNKTAENYFQILEDLLLAVRLPVFTKHSKREIYKRAKFLFFDVGVYRTLRPRGPLDSPEIIDGAALETLFYQHIRALNDYYDYDYIIYHWKTRSKLEVDFVMYGEKGLLAFEIKRKKNISKKDLKGLKEFQSDYSIAKCFLLYGGNQRQYIEGIELIPFEEGLKDLNSIISLKVAL